MSVADALYARVTFHKCNFSLVLEHKMTDNNLLNVTQIALTKVNIAIFQGDEIKFSMMGLLSRFSLEVARWLFGDESGPVSGCPVLRRMVEGGGRVFWAVQGVLVGGLALLAGLTLQRELAMHKLHREVGELKGLLVAFSGREITFDEKVFPILKFSIEYKTKFSKLKPKNPQIKVLLIRSMHCQLIQPSQIT